MNNWTFAFELFDANQEREVRAFLDALEVDYYILRNEGLNKDRLSYAVLVVHSADAVTVGSAIAPRDN